MEEAKKIQEQLSAPMPYNWKIQSVIGGKGNCWVAVVAYVTSRQVQDALDEAVGIDNWKDEYRIVGDRLICRLSLKINGEWISKEDAGTDSNMEPEKGGISDAFKRSAVKWRVGRFLYGLPMIYLPGINVREYKDSKGKTKYHADPATYGNKEKIRNFELSDYCHHVIKAWQDSGQELPDSIFFLPGSSGQSNGQSNGQSRNKPTAKTKKVDQKPRPKAGAFTKQMAEKNAKRLTDQVKKEGAEKVIGQLKEAYQEGIDPHAAQLIRSFAVVKKKEGAFTVALLQENRARLIKKLKSGARIDEVLADLANYYQDGVSKEATKELHELAKRIKAEAEKQAA